MSAKADVVWSPQQIAFPESTVLPSTNMFEPQTNAVPQMMALPQIAFPVSMLTTAWPDASMVTVAVGDVASPDGVSVLGANPPFAL